MLFELRQYRIKPGQQARWVEFMENVIIPFQQSKGMVILGSFVEEDDETVYIWIRRFRDEAEREAQYEAVYQSNEWKDKIGPQIPDMMDREGVVVRRLNATPHSPLQ
ncbi:MAG: NIPSNAP family containing protein [Dehalococcoidia bacterium]|nr:NIPSNAP family containing protein [Dehalococcoidia bacterium]|tara:strand:+ start:905 stop:1225 length:321 start_codon:yes stop_codon:yes gene_type:complete